MFKGKWNTARALLCIPLAFASAAMGSSDRMYAMLSEKPTAPGQDRIVHIELHNGSRLPIYIFDGYVPHTALDGMLDNNIFCVSDAHGREVPYTGWYAMYIMTERSFLRILPGQHIAIDVDLSRNYALPDGPVLVRLRSLLIQHRPSINSDDSAPTFPVTSNTLTLDPRSGHRVGPLGPLGC